MDIEWPPEAVGPATLCFIMHDESVLLIRKKRGAGKGMMNAPGGKLESNEPPCQGTTREVLEEVGVDVKDLEKHGEILFSIGSEPFSYVHIFVATNWEGTPTETPEGTPRWVRCDGLPFDKMWESDRLWIPRILGGEKLRGTIALSQDTETVCGFTLSPVDQFDSVNMVN